MKDIMSAVILSIGQTLLVSVGFAVGIMFYNWMNIAIGIPLSYFYLAGAIFVICLLRNLESLAKW